MLKDALPPSALQMLSQEQGQAEGRLPLDMLLPLALAMP